MNFTYKNSEDFVYPDLFNKYSNDSQLNGECDDVSIIFKKEINENIILFKNFTNPLDYKNLIKEGNDIYNKLNQINQKYYPQIFIFKDFNFFHLLINIILNPDAYFDNTLISIIFSIISLIIQSDTIDVSIFGTKNFLDCIINLSIPKIIKNDESHCILIALNLINEIIQDKFEAIENFIGHKSFFMYLISNFDSMDADHQMKICELFNQALIYYGSKSIKYDLNQPLEILRQFIENKIFQFENQPFFILDLISNSIKSKLINVNKLQFTGTAALENIINQIPVNKLNSLVQLNSMLNLINACFSSELQGETEEMEEFINTFHWDFFYPIIPSVLCENDFLNDELKLKVCETFCTILKRSRSLALESRNEINIPIILLNLVTFSDVSYKVKEVSLNALNVLVQTSPDLVFSKEEANMAEKETSNYLKILIDFFEAGANDTFLKEIVNSILYIVFCAEREIERSHCELHLDEEEEIGRDSEFPFIVDSIMMCQEELRENIEIVLNSTTSNDCKKLLINLQNHLEHFLRII